MIDKVIRIFDICGFYGIDLEKMAYNEGGKVL